MSINLECIKWDKYLLDARITSSNPLLQYVCYEFLNVCIATPEVIPDPNNPYANINLHIDVRKQKTADAMSSTLSSINTDIFTDWEDQASLPSNTNMQVRFMNNLRADLLSTMPGSAVSTSPCMGNIGTGLLSWDLGLYFCVNWVECNCP